MRYLFDLNDLIVDEQLVLIFLKQFVKGNSRDREVFGLIEQLPQAQVFVLAAAAAKVHGLVQHVCAPRKPMLALKTAHHAFVIAMNSVEGRILIVIVE